MKELAPIVWITALRRVQNPNRAGLDIVSEDKNFGALKVSPVFYWSDADTEDYLKLHNLPNEWDYFDPAKADEKRECGLHAAWRRDRPQRQRGFSNGPAHKELSNSHDWLPS